MSAKEKVNSVRTEEFLHRHPVFELGVFAKELGSKDSFRAAHERAKYHLSRGRLKRISKGLYAVVPYGLKPEQFVPDRYLVAKAARPDAIFCYHAALELLGVAHSQWTGCTVYTDRRRGALRFGELEVRFLDHPAAFVHQRHKQQGVVYVERLGQRLQVTGPERTLIEGFRNPGLAGGLEELWESVSGFGVLDLEVLKNTLKLYNQKLLFVAVGWFLEKHRERFFVSDEVLSSLEKRRPSAPQYLARGKRGGVMNSRWNLIVPESLVQGWEGHSV